LKPKFYYCEDCDSLVILVRESEIVMTCCGQPMIELIPGAVIAPAQKNRPVFRTEGNTVLVTVGTPPHPMEAAHRIQWVALQTRQTVQCRKLESGQSWPISFAVCEGDEVEAAYAYCSLHGLWRS